MKAVAHIDLGRARATVSLYGDGGKLADRVECNTPFVRLKVRSRAEILVPPTLSTGHTVLVLEGGDVRVRCGSMVEIEVGEAAGPAESGEEQE